PHRRFRPSALNRPQASSGLRPAPVAETLPSHPHRCHTHHRAPAVGFLPAPAPPPAPGRAPKAAESESTAAAAASTQAAAVDEVPMTDANAFVEKHLMKIDRPQPTRADAS